MRLHTAVAGLLLAAAGCATATKAVPALPPLAGEGEVHVLVLPLPREAEPLSFTVEAVTLRRVDGGEVPLALETPSFSGADRRDQRPLAAGRVPPGEYAALSVKLASASVVREGEPARLLVDPEPSRVELSFRVAPGGAQVVWVTLDPAAARSVFAFAPGFKATLASQTPPQVALYCTNTGDSSVTVVDRRAKLVTGIVPVGAEPRGIALDRTASRAYVALSREDQLDVVDVAANASIGRIRLRPGDGPGDVAFGADGILVVADVRSRTVSFVDPSGMVEVGRVQVGEDPEALLVDRSGRRAYVVNRGSATISVIDVPNRSVVGTISTDPEPLKLGLSADGSRLYVVHRGSSYLAAYALPSLAPQARVYVGLGAAAVRVDPRTDLVYVSWLDGPRISVHDPLSLQPVDRFELPGRVSQMTIDDAENALVAVVPERRVVAVVDLTSRRLVAELPVGREPYAVALSGERF